jgi:hypothetical protein
LKNSALGFLPVAGILLTSRLGECKPNSDENHSFSLSTVLPSGGRGNDGA